MSGDELARLAEELAAAHDGLDFTLASLDALQALVLGQPVAEATTRRWGAYLGETIRRACPDQVRWVDHATAAAASAMIAQLEPGPDLAAILLVGTGSYWFPLAKIEKLQRDGAADGLRPFAALALAPVRPPDPAAEAAHREAKAREDAAMLAAAAAFLAGPSAETLRAFARQLSFAVHRSRHGDALRRAGIRVEHLIGFLAEAPRGRGWKRRDPGGEAAALITTLVVDGGALREPTIALLRERLADRARTTRGNAAHALAYLDLREGRAEVAAELAGARDRAVAAGAWQALGSAFSDLRMDYLPTVTLAPLLPTFTAALAPGSPHLAVALACLRDVAFEWPRCAELAPLIPALIAVGDPAAELIARYLWAVVHGHAPHVPAIDALAAEGGLAEPLERIRGAATPRR